MKRYSRRQALIQYTTMASTAIMGTGLANLILSQTRNTMTMSDKLNTMDPYPAEWLPNGIRSRFVEDINGLRMHVLEAGYETDSRLGILLLHERK